MLPPELLDSGSLSGELLQFLTQTSLSIVTILHHFCSFRLFYHILLQIAE